MAAAQLVSSTRIQQFFKNVMSMNIKGVGRGRGAGVGGRRVEVADRPSIKTPFPFYTWAGTFSVYVVVQGQICNTYKLI